MKCYYHPDLDSANSCSVCSKFLCASCSHTIKGKVYCQDCLVAGAELATIASSPRFANYSPARAALFAIVPGLGAVYNRQYVKAVVHFAIFAGLAMLADEVEGIFVLGAISFYVFMIVDAYRSAQSILRQQVAHPETIEEESEEINLPVWGSVLVLMGVLFFLGNLGVFSLREVIRFGWPLIFVAGGIYLILDYYLLNKGRSSEKRVNAVEGSETAENPEASPGEFKDEENG
ncbi:DUF5668 domain-containing protein [Acidobacteria bacterium AH-259-G07]|nr:DUF5668 domain-containing protein [Acidobacteria bacterium AH-259-G07]